ncbi:bacterioferritin-associated ferredoxin [Alteromonadaceae bacterium Bs31]|nr:bacterioferritin-associated ferredoxin [Alteromonadaceae bacterium Bs31]
MYICLCNAITDRQVEQAVNQGARQLKDLRSLLGVSKDCGRCTRCAKQCLKSSLEQQHEQQQPNVVLGRL